MINNNFQTILLQFGTVCPRTIILRLKFNLSFLKINQNKIIIYILQTNIFKIELQK